MHQIREPLRTAGTDVEIISHQQNTDECGDVTRHENRVRQSAGSFTLLNGISGSEDLSVCVVGTGVRPTPALLDAGKSVAAATTAAYVVSKDLSQFQDACQAQDIVVSGADNVDRLPCENISSSCNPLVSRSCSPSAEDLTHNPSSTAEVIQLLPLHFSGIGTSSFHLSYTENQHTASRAENFVSASLSIPRSPTPQGSVFSSNNNSSCETVADPSFLTVSSELPSSCETTPEDLPALLCSFLFGSPDSVTSCESAVTTVDEDTQNRCKNGSMDCALSPSTSDITRLQPDDNEAKNCEILRASPTKSDAGSVVSVSGDEIRTEGAEKQIDEGRSEVLEVCNTKQCVEEVSSTTDKRHTNSHVKEVQRGISEESGYLTSSENHVTSGMETSTTTTRANEENDKIGDRDDEDDDSDMDEQLVLVPSGE